MESFRNIGNDITSLLSKKISIKNNVTLKRKNCDRLCLFQSNIYCAYLSDNCIDIYNMNGDFIKTINIDQVRRPRSLHPIDANHLIVAAENTIPVINSDGKIITQNIIRPGNFFSKKKPKFWDVHVSGENIAVLGKGVDGSDDTIHIVSTVVPYKQKAVFSLKQNKTLSILLVQQILYVSDWNKDVITTYSLTGDQLAEYGTSGRSKKAGELFYPHLAGIDCIGNVLVADWRNHRLQILLSGEKEWVIVEDIDVGHHPVDIIINKNIMYLLNNGGENIYMYELQI